MINVVCVCIDLSYLLYVIATGDLTTYPHFNRLLSNMYWKMAIRFCLWTVVQKARDLERALS